MRKLSHTSLLGLVLLIIYINDVDVGHNNLINRFAENTKTGNSVLSDKDKQIVQEDLQEHQFSLTDERCSIIKILTRFKLKKIEGSVMKFVA